MSTPWWPSCSAGGPPGPSRRRSSCSRRAAAGATARPAPRLLPGRQAGLYRHFDRIAELAEARAQARPDVRPDPSIDAYAVLDQLARLRGEVDTLAAGVARAEGELSAVQATKAWRLL